MDHPDFSQFEARARAQGLDERYGSEGATCWVARRNGA
jgi:hypothetical protein